MFAIAQGYHFDILAVSLALLGAGASGTCPTLRPTLRHSSVVLRLARRAVIFSLSLVASYLAVIHSILATDVDLVASPQRCDGTRTDCRFSFNPRLSASDQCSRLLKQNTCSRRVQSTRPRAGALSPENFRLDRARPTVHRSTFSAKHKPSPGTEKELHMVCLQKTGKQNDKRALAQTFESCYNAARRRRQQLTESAFLFNIVLTRGVWDCDTMLRGEGEATLFRAGCSYYRFRSANSKGVVSCIRTI